MNTDAHTIAVACAVALLRGISTAAGYATAPLAIWEDEPEFSPELDLPDRGIRVTVVDESSAPGGAHETVVTLAIIGSVPADPTGQPAERPRARARAFIADVRRAMAANDELQDPAGVDRIAWVGADIPARDEQSNFIEPTVRYSITVNARLANQRG